MQPQYTPESTPTKQCSKCKEWKPATKEYFGSKGKKCPDKLQPRCKACAAKYRAAHKKKASEYHRAWRAANREREKERLQTWYQQNRDEQLEYRRAYYRANKEKRSQQDRIYRAANRERIHERERTYRVRNQEKKKEYYRAYYAANRQRASEKGREYYKANRAEVIQRTRRWRNANKEIARASVRNRKAQRRAAPGNFRAADVIRIYERQHGLCAYCQLELANSYHVDHIIPISRGGSNHPDNLAVTCAHCNLSKHNSLLYVEWAPPNPLP